MTKTGWFFLLALLAAVLGALQQHAAAVRQGLRADSLEAVADTSRRLLTDSLVTVWGRRVVQAELRADSLDHRLRLRPAVVTRTVVHLDTLTDTIIAPVVVHDSTRHADFRVRQVPYTLLAHAALPPPPVEGRLAVTVTLDPLPLDLRVGCGPKVGPVRPATATASGPPWATLDLREVRADPDVCNAQPITVTGMPWWGAGLVGIMGLLVGISLW